MWRHVRLRALSTTPDRRIHEHETVDPLVRRRRFIGRVLRPYPRELDTYDRRHGHSGGHHGTGANRLVRDRYTTGDRDPLDRNPRDRNAAGQSTSRGSAARWRRLMHAASSVDAAADRQPRRDRARLTNIRARRVSDIVTG